MLKNRFCFFLKEVSYLYSGAETCDKQSMRCWDFVMNENDNKKHLERKTANNSQITDNGELTAELRFLQSNYFHFQVGVRL